MTTMTYVNIFTKDIKKLSKFYIDVFGFEEDMGFVRLTPIRLKSRILAADETRRNW